jgi:hypothetical protein
MSIISLVYLIVAFNIPKVYLIKVEYMMLVHGYILCIKTVLFAITNRNHKHNIVLVDSYCKFHSTDCLLQ